MTKIILIRHCKTEGNKSGIIQGKNNDTSFSDEGLVQLKKLAESLKKEKIDAVFCSDLRRAMKTAEAIAREHGLKVIPLKDLREANIGEWIKFSAKEAIQKWISYYEEEKLKGISRENIRPPEGENTWDHQKRIFEALNQLIKEYASKTIVIVGHAGTNKVILGTYLKKDPDDFYSVPQDNACINIILAEEDSSHVEKINDTEHLK